MLYIVHGGLAAVTGHAVLALTMEEAKLMGEATANVLQHYSTKASQKTIAIGKLVAVAGSIYGPRAVLVMQGRSKPQPQQETPPEIRGASEIGIFSPQVVN